MLILLSNGCNQDKKPSPAVQSDKARLHIVASFYPLYIMARNVVADVPGVQLENLAPAAVGCLHDYSPGTDDFKKLASADIFITQGAGMEGFLDKVSSSYPQLKIVKLSDGIPLLTNNGVPNPHTWLNIDYAMVMVRNLEQALTTYDPDHAPQYRRNAEVYLSKLRGLRDEIKAMLDPHAGAEIITFHDAFAYFAREFGLTVAAVVEREPGSEPSAQELVSLINLIKARRIEAIFTEPQYPAQIAQTIASETGIKVLNLDPIVTGADDPDAYLDAMRANAGALKEALQ